MKRILLAVILGALFLIMAKTPAQAGEVDVLVQKLVEKNILTPADAQIILDETKIQVSKDLAQAKSLSVPEWTQRIPSGSVVISGTLPKNGGQYSLYAAIIVKRVDAQTRAKTSLNDLLRD